MKDFVMTGSNYTQKFQVRLLKRKSNHGEYLKRGKLIAVLK